MKYRFLHLDWLCLNDIRTIILIAGSAVGIIRGLYAYRCLATLSSSFSIIPISLFIGITYALLYAVICPKVWEYFWARVHGFCTFLVATASCTLGVLFVASVSVFFSRMIGIKCTVWKTFSYQIDTQLLTILVVSFLVFCLRNLQTIFSSLNCKNLDAKLHPHTLQHAVAALVEMAKSKSENLLDAILLFEEFLKSTQISRESDSHTMIEERRLTDLYLALESLHLKERLKVNYEWDDRVNNLLIPPLALQTICENGITHGISQLMDGGTLNITAKRLPRGMELTISNDGGFQRSRRRKGGAIRNLKSRLVHEYGIGASLDVIPGDAQTKVIINIPAKLAGRACA